MKKDDVDDNIENGEYSPNKGATMKIQLKTHISKYVEEKHNIFNDIKNVDNTYRLAIIRIQPANPTISFNKETYQVEDIGGSNIKSMIVLVSNDNDTEWILATNEQI